MAAIQTEDAPTLSIELTGGQVKVSWPAPAPGWVLTETNRLTGSGSLAVPRIDGQVDASQIRFAMPEAGIAITDGTLELVLADDRVRVQQGELKGRRGRIVVSGEGQLKNPQAGITLDFEKFAATHRSDRRVIVSGITRLNLDQKRLQLTGELKADYARLEIPEASRPALSSKTL